MPMTEITARLSTALADRYAIQEELGAGGMATVYLVEDLKHDRKVAVKVWLLRIGRIFLPRECAVRDADGEPLRS